jgi:hypothetical protein
VRKLFTDLSRKSKKGVEDKTMVAYEFYRLDSTGGYQIIGVLPERRKDPGRMTQECIINWGKKFFAKDLDIFFIRITIDDRTGQISRPIPFSITRKDISE